MFGLPIIRKKEKLKVVLIAISNARYYIVGIVFCTVQVIGNHNELSPIRQDSDLVWLTCCCYVCCQIITGYTIDRSSIFYGHAIIVVTKSGFEINRSVTVSMDQFQSITNPFKTHSLSHVPLFVPCSMQQLRLLFLLLSPQHLLTSTCWTSERQLYIYLLDN